jgi:hypothetical protein
MTVARSRSPQIVAPEAAESIQPKGRAFSAPALALDQTSALDPQDPTPIASRHSRISPIVRYAPLLPALQVAYRPRRWAVPTWTG